MARGSRRQGQGCTAGPLSGQEGEGRQEEDEEDRRSSMALHGCCSQGDSPAAATAATTRESRDGWNLCAATSAAQDAGLCGAKKKRLIALACCFIRVGFCTFLLFLFFHARQQVACFGRTFTCSSRDPASPRAPGARERRERERREVKK